MKGCPMQTLPHVNLTARNEMTTIMKTLLAP